MKRAILTVLAAVVLMSLIACGGGNSDDPNVGTWIGASVDLFGFGSDIKEVYPNGTTIELKANGRAVLELDGDKVNVKWSLSGTKLTFSGSDMDLNATIIDNVLTLEVMDGMYIIFTRDGRAPPSSPSDDSAKEGTSGEPTATPEPVVVSGDDASVAIAWWEGDWYGTFYVYDANDAYAGEIGTFWDVYAVIETMPNGTATAYLWTEDLEMGTVVFTINADGGGAMGTAVAESGVLFDDGVAYGDWNIDPSTCQYDNMIEIREIHTDSDGDWFDYEILLRPWGMDWEDVQEADQPIYYSWYTSSCYRPMLEVAREVGEMNHSQIR